MTTQAELIAAVAKDAGVSQADAGRVLDALVKNIHKSLTGGGDVRISNLGVFDTAARAAREGRNPATGATSRSPHRRLCASACRSRSRMP
jgi:DNA-binding protein HU-beta